MDTELNKEMRESFSLLVASAITLAAMVGLAAPPVSCPRHRRRRMN